MSLFTDAEVCGTCIRSTMYDCGNCLKACELGLSYNSLDGACEGYEGHDDWLVKKANELRRSRDKNRQSS